MFLLGACRVKRDRTMNFMKFAFADPKRKPVSGFGLGIGASLVVLALMVTLVPFYLEVHSLGVRSPLLAWPFSFSGGIAPSSSSSLSQASNLTGNLCSPTVTSGVRNKSLESFSKATHESNLTKEAKTGSILVGGVGKLNTHMVNSTKDGNLMIRRASIREKNETREATGLVDAKLTGLDSNSSRGGVFSGEFHESNFSRESTVRFSGSGSSSLNNVSAATNGSNVVTEQRDSRAMEIPTRDCDIFDGRWVRDDSKPYYPANSCPHVDRDFNCHLNGRPDDGFVKWKWQPIGCNIQRLNATDFLERLRGRRLVFVGDSLNRNMWESLVCILRQSVRDKKSVYEISGRTEFKKKGFYAFRFEGYNCSIDFVAAPFLVRESSFKDENGSFETLRLDLMDRTTSMYHDADVIVFNTGHWWTHEKTSRGENYYQEGRYVHPKLKVFDAYRRALRTWANWTDRNIDQNRTRVLFRGYSVTHFRGGQWNSGGQCHKETEPIFNETYLEKYPSKMRVLEDVLQEMKTPVTYLNISRLTDYRKDGHPSIYRTIYKTEEERITAERSQDCSHWCLPGVPDTWNELLYASLLKLGW